MNEQVIQSTRNDIHLHLDRQRLKDALQRLEAYLFDLGMPELSNALEQMQTAYSYMLGYLRKGVDDPERHKVYTRLLASAHELTDRIWMVHMEKQSTNYYFDRKRLYRRQSLRSYEQLLLTLEAYTEECALDELPAAGIAINRPRQADIRLQHDRAYAELFYRTWLAPAWSEADLEDARRILTSVLIPANDVALFVSALTLSLFVFFDQRKMCLLLEAYDHTSLLVNRRALVGVALVADHYARRIPLYPTLHTRLALLQEEPRFANELNQLQIQLLLSREAPKVEQKMRQEILPEIIKGIRQEQARKAADEADEDNGQADLNPDWENWAENAGLMDKFKEMSEMQAEGVDMYAGTFAQLKNFPFFADMANWFYPFDPRHSMLQGDGTASATSGMPGLERLMESPLFCHSDRYSFAFTLKNIPEAQRTFIQMHTNDDENFLQSEAYNTVLQQGKKNPAMICNQYVQDLYRFFKQFPHRMSFHDIFANPLHLYECPVWQPSFAPAERRQAIAEYFLRKGYTDEALALFQELCRQTADDMEVWQKMGYCLQQLKRYDEAIAAYERADLLRPGQRWTMRQLAVCHRQCRQWERALAYYKKVEEQSPDDLKLTYPIGLCLIELHRYDEALDYFFKMEYFQPSSEKAWRAIAWCSLLTRHYEQARTYYQKLLGHTSLPEDWLNLGHVYWAMGDLPQAIIHYECAGTRFGDKEALFAHLEADRDILVSAGIPASDLPLMRDLLDS